MILSLAPGSSRLPAIAARPFSLGIMLSWDGQFDRAGVELRRVLARDPNNGVAQQALQRIELLSKLKTTARKSELIVGANYDDYENSDSCRSSASLALGLRF